MSNVNGAYAAAEHASPARASSELADSYTADHAWLVQLFRRRGIPSHEADDLAQETVLRTLLHLKRHGRRQSDLRPLMRAISHNLLVERVRRSARVSVTCSDGFDLADTCPDPEEAMVASERVAAVRRAVRSLSPRHRLAVHLWMRGRTPTEIAHELGIKRNAADAILHRARRSLAAKLEGGIFGAAIPALFVRLRAQARRLTDAFATLDPGAALTQSAGVIAMLSAATAISLSALPATTEGSATTTPAGSSGPADQEANPSGQTASDHRSGEVDQAGKSAQTPGNSTVVVDLHNQSGQIGGTRTGRDGEEHFIGVEWKVDRHESGERGETEALIDQLAEEICTGLPRTCDTLSGR